MTTPNMGLTLPVDHGSSDTWDLILDTAFGLIDGHDHTPGKGPLVPVSALSVLSDLSFSSAGVSRAITNLRAIDFSAQPAVGVAALAGALFLSDGTSGLVNNELYYRTTGGANVQLTAGSALNIAGFVGGIGGDYSAVGALLLFDDATDAYWFQQQVGASVRQYARMRCGDVELFEYKAQPAAGVPTTRVRLASPAALAASYQLTMLAALPASQLLMQVSAAGQLTASNVMAANQDITISGTAKFKHPTITDIISPFGFTPDISVATATSASLSFFSFSGSAGSAVLLSLRVRIGQNISAIRVRCIDNVTGPTKVSAQYSNDADGVSTGNGNVVSAGSGAWQTITITPAAPLVVASKSYFLRLALSGGGSVCSISRIEIDYDQP